MTLGFWLALVLVLVLTFSPPTALLLYRLAVKHWVSPAPAPAANPARSTS